MRRHFRLEKHHAVRLPLINKCRSDTDRGDVRFEPTSFIREGFPLAERIDDLSNLSRNVVGQRRDLSRRIDDTRRQPVEIQVGIDSAVWSLNPFAETIGVICKRRSQAIR